MSRLGHRQGKLVCHSPEPPPSRVLQGEEAGAGGCDSKSWSRSGAPAFGFLHDVPTASCPHGSLGIKVMTKVVFPIRRPSSSMN